MNNLESAIYNRISTKCHLFTKTYYPGEYKKLAAAAILEYETRQSRRTSQKDLEEILSKPSIPGKNLEIPADENYWNDPVFPMSSEGSECNEDIL